MEENEEREFPKERQDNDLNENGLQESELELLDLIVELLTLKIRENE